MGALLDRYERQATVLSRGGGLDDLAELAALQARRWARMGAEIRASGDPTMLEGGYAGLEINPNPATLAAVTIGATELALWPTAWSPIPANIKAPKAFRLVAFGTATTAATPGTEQFLARLGTSNAAPSLGSSVTAAPTASETTTLWKIWGDLVIRTPGAASTATAVGIFHHEQGTATTGASAVLPAMEQIFGGVVASFDSTVAQALWMGALAVTSTTNTRTPLAVIFASWN